MSSNIFKIPTRMVSIIAVEVVSSSDPLSIRADIRPLQREQIHPEVAAPSDTLPHVYCIVRARLPTPFGADMYLHLYKNEIDDKEHLAMVFGKSIVSASLNHQRPDDTELSRLKRGAVNHIPNFAQDASADTLWTPQSPNAQRGSEAPLVRVHSECFTGETSWSLRCDCGDQLDTAARRIVTSPSGSGAIVYLRQEGRGIGLANKLRAYNLQDQGADTVQANEYLGLPVDGRTFGVATAILCDLGLGGQPGIRLMTNNPDKVASIAGPRNQIHVQEVCPMPPSACRKGGEGSLSNELMAYLQTKVQKLGHSIEM
ncbi:putative GTP cyclohydrolase-2 [Aspergillus minisclerotigenes]|uniref:GTP cyclohydrolase II n=1 Tax=Aspergillus minisclerotigenes TaxID=656917 RepID=A0A5N6IZC7_9EURO|nr:putative GTP cyclohydrolase-2 [Aspergillus minisclerotigenes]